MTPPTFDELVHAPNRLQICAILAAVDSADFATLREGLGVADSVVSKHLATLEEAGYLAIHKARCGPRSRTTVSLTPTGRTAYESHVAALRTILDEGVGRTNLAVRTDRSRRK